MEGQEYVVDTPKKSQKGNKMTSRKNLISVVIPVHLQGAYEDLGYKKGDFPQSERAASEVLSLPMYPELPYEAIDEIANCIRNCQG